MRPIHWTTLLTLVLALAACQGTPQPASTATSVTGRGRITTLDQTLGIGTLDVNGKNVNFWWRNSIARPNRKDSPLPTDTLQGSYAPTTVDIPLDAKVGDEIVFRGFMSGQNEICITNVATLK